MIHMLWPKISFGFSQPIPPIEIVVIVVPDHTISREFHLSDTFVFGSYGNNRVNPE